MLLKSRIFTFFTGLILITNPITFSAALAQEVTPPEQEVTEPDPVLDIPKPTNFESDLNESVESDPNESVESDPNKPTQSVPGKPTQSVSGESVSTESVPPDGGGSSVSSVPAAPGCSSNGYTLEGSRIKVVQTDSRILGLYFSSVGTAFASLDGGGPGDVFWIDRRNTSAGKVTRYCGKTTLTGYYSALTKAFNDRGSLQARACIIPRLYISAIDLTYYGPESCTGWY